MNKLFVDDLIERLEFGFDTVQVTTQDGVKSKLIEMGECDHFPMICYEHTSDSSFDVDISESNFFNSLSHIGTWIIGMNEDEIIFIANLKNRGNTRLEIDTLEIRDELRGQGLGGNIISIIESVAEQYFNDIVISPFDTDAINFWEHMDYEEGNNGYWVKNLND